MLALHDEWLADPDYSALILRKTFVDLNQPEGILNRAQEWLMDKPGVIWQAQHNRFVFESGAILQFGHCNAPRDHYKYRGGKYNLVCWDELTDFPEDQYTFLFSRQRRPQGSSLPLLTVAASNPGGTGHAWVRERFIRTSQPGRLFIAASYHDNPHLDRDEYGKTLDNLLPVERARIKYGDWDVLDNETLFDLAWFRYYSELPQGSSTSVRAWDTAATPGGGDYTVGIKMVRIGDDFYIDDMVRGQWGPAEVEQVQIQTAELDGPTVRIMLEEEPGSAGKRVNQILMQKLRKFHVSTERNTGDKLVRAVPSARAMSNGKLHIAKKPWTKSLVDEMISFTGNEKIDQHDDIVDSVSLAYNGLVRKTALRML